MVISFVNQKGGCGKSTFATNFACISAIEKFKTLLVDMDPQRSAINFREIRPDDRPQFQAISVLNPTIHKDISSFDFDYAYIDSGGRDSKLFRSAMIASDQIVIPIMAGQFDIWSLEDTIEILEEIRTINPQVKAGIALNHVVPNTNISKGAMKAVMDFAGEHNLKVFETMLHSRVAFAEAAAEGLSVVEIEGEKYNKAKEEMSRLYKEVMNDRV